MIGGTVDDELVLDDEDVVQETVTANFTIVTLSRGGKERTVVIAREPDAPVWEAEPVIDLDRV